MGRNDVSSALLQRDGRRDLSKIYGRISAQIMILKKIISFCLFFFGCLVKEVLDEFKRLDRALNTREYNSSIVEPPLLIQFRLFNNGYAVKGTLLINKQLPFRTIHIRPSMIKVQTDPDALAIQSNSLEIVGTRWLCLTGGAINNK
ncbi:probable RNA-dependent RNA polymerase 3 isoform X1 [Dendrobium catenatum]|uniref:probable RNA-dependent RNA polymerase 3 isoform X1 n=2 Tax=Dendrobium catenatum TaxID=906689 RepID=UPI00109EF27A|nr:probable RNA-dependent RNA polymerase 3 isoform X1 [Dendrobium catenatum]